MLDGKSPGSVKARAAAGPPVQKGRQRKPPREMPPPIPLALGRKTVNKKWSVYLYASLQPVKKAVSRAFSLRERFFAQGERLVRMGKKTLNFKASGDMCLERLTLRAPQCGNLTLSKNLFFDRLNSVNAYPLLRFT